MVKSWGTQVQDSSLSSVYLTLVQAPRRLQFFSPGNCSCKGILWGQGPGIGVGSSVPEFCHLHSSPERDISSSGLDKVTQTRGLHPQIMQGSVLRQLKSRCSHVLPAPPPTGTPPPPRVHEIRRGTQKETEQGFQAPTCLHRHSLQSIASVLSKGSELHSLTSMLLWWVRIPAWTPWSLLWHD